MQKFDDKPTFRQIPFSQIKERIENGDEIVLDIYSLIKSRLDVFDQEFRYFERASR
jgi:hypothetical protein